MTTKILGPNKHMLLQATRKLIVFVGLMLNFIRDSSQLRYILVKRARDRSITGGFLVPLYAIYVGETLSFLHSSG